MAEKNVPQREEQFSNRLIIFLFFLVGALISYFSSLEFPASFTPRLFLCGMTGAVLLSSASIFGVLLLPACALASGAFAEQTACAWVNSWYDGAGSVWSLVASAVLIPVFFLCAVHGMAVSGAVQSALTRGSPSARTAYQREIFAVTFFAVIGFAAIFYFT